MKEHLLKPKEKFLSIWPQDGKISKKMLFSKKDFYFIKLLKFYLYVRKLVQYRIGNQYLGFLFIIKPAYDIFHINNIKEKVCVSSVFFIRLIFSCPSEEVENRLLCDINNNYRQITNTQLPFFKKVLKKSQLYKNKITTHPFKQP